MNLLAMIKFLAGPPGGLTLPPTATRISDLEGGVYGPGASVASTGINAQRPSIQAFLSRASGETWEDILEYYLVSPNTTHDIETHATALVQRQSSGTHFRISARQDLLPRKYIPIARWHKLWGRGCRCHSP